MDTRTLHDWSVIFSVRLSLHTDLGQTVQGEVLRKLGKVNGVMLVDGFPPDQVDQIHHSVVDIGLECRHFLAGVLDESVDFFTDS